MKNNFDLSSKRVAVLATHGFEQSELMTPVEVLQMNGATVDIISPDGDAIRGWEDEEWGQKLTADFSLDDVLPEDYDAILLPGGVMNSDSLRKLPQAVEFSRHFLEAKKPTFVICHGAQVLIEADVVKGRKMTSFESIATDLKNAGAIWQDSEVVCDQGFVTSRSPDDLPAFCAKMCEELAEGVHA